MSDAAQSPGNPLVQEIQDGTESEQLSLALEPTSQNPVYPSTDPRDRFKAASTIEEKRSHVRGEVRYFIPEVDLDSFVKFLLPPLQDGIDLKTAVSFLEREGLVTPSRRWKVFETPPAKRRGETERKMSEPLAGVYKSLIEHVSHHADIKPILTLSLPSTTPGESHDKKSMVTEGFRVTNKESKLQRYDIALTAVFRKRNSPEDREGVSRTHFDVHCHLTFFPEHKRSLAQRTTHRGIGCISQVIVWDQGRDREHALVAFLLGDSRRERGFRFHFSESYAG